MAEAETKPDPPKKKERPAQPPPPPAISTAYVLVRHAISSLLAPVTSNDDVKAWLDCAPFQATFLKETPRLTGKVGMTASKAAAAVTPLLDDKAQHLSPPLTPTMLVETLQTILNRLVHTNDYSLSYCSVTKQSLREHFGDVEGASLLEESHVGKKSKTKPTDSLTLVLLHQTDDNDSNHKKLVFACFAPGIPYASPSTALQSIVLDAAQCDVKASKKGLLVSVKWEAMLAQEESPALALLQESDLPATVPAPSVSMEGQALIQQVLELQQQQEQQAKEEEEATQKQAAAATQPQEMKVDPFNVEGTIDYNKLVEQFGSTLIDPDLLQRFQALISSKAQQQQPLHRFLRRQLFFSHRDLHSVVSSLEQGTAPVYLYTGRGPSSSAMHLGHLVPFLFTQWLQQALNCPLVIQMTDDEKFLFKGEYDETTGDNLDHFAQLTMENARDIIACGFEYDKTFLFSDLDYVGRMYPNICRIWKAVTTNTVNNMFGFDGSSNMGKIAFPAIQAAPSFASSFPTVLNVPSRRSTNQMCLIPCAIDQDPYFRMTRDVAHKLVDKTIHPLGGKPALIHSKFFPPLQGAQGKMSSSNTNSAIFLTDTPDEIAQKIRSYCFSGGRETKAEQEKYGADLEIDVAYQWLRFFLEDDDELERIGKDYSSGSGEYWSTGKVKERLIVVLQELVIQHQKRRAQITDEEVRKWMTERCIVPSS